MYKNGSKAKFRVGIGIGLQELKENISKAREFNTDLIMNPAYIGFIDSMDMMLRLYIFTNKINADKMLDQARKMNFRTAGSIPEPIHIRNADLERPHMKYVSKWNWHRELYK